MRQILCAKCSVGREPGEYQSEYPGEYVRVVFGKAKSPLKEQRMVEIGKIDPTGKMKLEKTIELELDHFDCDQCSAPIRPGDPACAFSAWVGGRRVPEWEGKYLE